MACAFMQLFCDLKWERIIIAAMTVECFDKNINVVECFFAVYTDFDCVISTFYLFN